MPFLKDLMIQPSFKTNVSFISPSFINIMFIYLSDLPCANGTTFDYAYYVTVINLLYLVINNWYWRTAEATRASERPLGADIPQGN